MMSDMICRCGHPSKEKCAVIWNETLAKEFSDFRYGRVHRLTVDTYSLQHPDVYMISSKSYAAHLTGMCVAMEYDNDSGLLKILQKWLNGKKELEKPELLQNVGRLTISHLVAARDGIEHMRLVKEWSAGVWSAYSVHHALAKEWIEQAKKEISL